MSGATLGFLIARILHIAQILIIAILGLGIAVAWFVVRIYMANPASFKDAALSFGLVSERAAKRGIEENRSGAPTRGSGGTGTAGSVPAPTVVVTLPLNDAQRAAVIRMCDVTVEMDGERVPIVVSDDPLAVPCRKSFSDAASAQEVLDARGRQILQEEGPEAWGDYIDSVFPRLHY